MSLKISILTSSDFPYGMAMESFVRQLSFGLHSNNVNLEVIRLYGNRFNNVNDTEIKCSNYLFNKPFQYELFKVFEIMFQVLFIPIFIFYRKILKNDDAILMYGLDRSYFVFPFTIFSKLLKLKTFRIITEIYSEHTYVTNLLRKPLVFFNESQIKYFDKYLDGIVVLSNFLKEMELKSGVKDNRILLIPHFIRFDTKPSGEFDKNNILKFRIGFCGNPTLENGIIDLIDAFSLLRAKRLNQVELIIIGEINPVVLKEIANRSLENIIFTGKLSSKDVLIELEKCSVLVNPRRISISADSGFPTKIGEYFAAKKTVIATMVGDLCFYFKDKRELIFAEANNPLSIYSAIDYAFENPHVAFEIAKRGNQWAIQNLDYKNNSKKLIEFIKESL